MSAPGLSLELGVFGLDLSDSKLKIKAYLQGIQ